MVNLVASSIDVVHHHLGILTESGSLEGTVIVRIGDSCVKITVTSYCSFLVPEPFGGDFADVFRSHVTDSSGNFSAVDDAIYVCGLTSVTGSNISGVVAVEEVVEIFVSGSEYFSLVDLNNYIRTY